MVVINGDANANLIYGDQAGITPLTPLGADFIGQENTVDRLFGRGGDDTIYGLGGSDLFINGNEGNDVLSGGPGDDDVSGGVGEDTLLGGTGTDKLFGNRGNDLLFGLEDDDFVNGGQQDDTIFGGLGNDELSGNENSDRVFGGEGNDTLDGGQLSTDATPNVDSLTGGGGSDTFRLRPHDTTTTAHLLTITDYLDNTDKLSIFIDNVNDNQVKAMGGADVAFPDLTFIGVNVGGDPTIPDTEISFMSPGPVKQVLAILWDTNPATITAADFV